MITFDFDETLTRPLWNPEYNNWEPSSTPNCQVIASLKAFHQQNQEVSIVTTRHPCEEVFDFVKDHNLPITQIHFTKGKLKGETLLMMGSTLQSDKFTDNYQKAQLLLIVAFAANHR